MCRTAIFPFHLEVETSLQIRGERYESIGNHIRHVIYWAVVGRFNIEIVLTPSKHVSFLIQLGELEYQGYERLVYPLNILPP